MAEEPKSHGWWQTIPGILTATAGIITAITGLIVGLNQAGFFAGDERPAQQLTKPESRTETRPESQIEKSDSSNNKIDLYTSLDGFRTYL